MRKARGGAGPADTFSGYRVELVETLRTRGIRDLAVLNAIAQVPRHQFVPSAVRHRAYEDQALPIGEGQTISQPFVQARSLEILELTGSERVLEIGTGSGYQTALLAELADQVFSVERIGRLAVRARQALRESGVVNASILIGDGTIGWRAYAPYDAIVVAAGGPRIPQPLVDQLKPGGRMLIPVGDPEFQRLTLVTTPDGNVRVTTLDATVFVPLVGEHGYPDA